MFSAFFISRPKFAFVISIIICIAGLIAITVLPVALYPNLAPPQVKVSAALIQVQMRKPLRIRLQDLWSPKLMALRI